MALSAIVGVYKADGKKFRWVGVYHSPLASPDPEESVEIMPNKGSGFNCRMSLDEITRVLKNEGKTNLLERIVEAMEEAKPVKNPGRFRSIPKAQMFKLLKQTFGVNIS